MPFDLPSQDQIAALIGLPGVRNVEASQKLYDTAVEQGRKTAAYNALKNIYGPIVGNLDYLQMQQAQNQKSLTAERDAMLPGALQAQRDVSAARQTSTMRDAQTLPYDMATKQAGVEHTQAGTKAQGIQNQNAEMFQKNTAALLGTQAIDAALGYDPQTKTFRGDPEQVFSRIPPPHLEALGIRPEDAAQWGSYVKQHPEAWQEFKDTLAEQRRTLMLSATTGKGGLHVSKTEFAYGGADGQQPGYNVTMSNGQTMWQPSTGTPLTLQQKTPGYQGQVAQSKAVGQGVGKEIVAAPEKLPAMEALLHRSIAVPQAVDQALQMVDRMAEGAVFRKGAAHIPGTPEYQYDALLQQIGNNLKLTDLQSMRTTGFSLGRVTIPEFQGAGDAYGNLHDLGQSKDMLKQNLLRIKEMYTKLNTNAEEDIKRVRGLTKQNPTTSSQPQFKEGTVYTDKAGNRARYEGGKFVPVQ